MGPLTWPACGRSTRKFIKLCYKLQWLAGARDRGLLQFDLSVLFYIILYLKESNYFFGLVTVLYVVHGGEVFTYTFLMSLICLGFQNKLWNLIQRG